MNDAVRYDDGMVEVFRHADSLAATVPDDGKRSYLFDLITVLQPNPSGLRRWSVMQKIRKLRQDSDRRLTRLLLEPRLGIGDLPTIASLIVERGGLVHALALADHHLDQARRLLGELPDPRLRTAIADAADAISASTP